MMPNDYELVGIDKMEPSLLRRKIDPGQSECTESLKRIIEAVFSWYGYDKRTIQQPRWETGVYPLYYWYFSDPERQQKQSPYKHILNKCEKCFSLSAFSPPLEDIYKRIGTIADAEIDLLVEDIEYFILIEAKKPLLPGQKPVFGQNYGLHQLVRQYLQGLFLAKVTKKNFLMATIGTGLKKPYELTTLEQDYLKAFGKDIHNLTLPDFDWTIFDSVRGDRADDK
jgi:hypothetical protein